jgi:hypothetical protein
LSRIAVVPKEESRQAHGEKPGGEREESDTPFEFQTIAAAEFGIERGDCR